MEDMPHQIQRLTTAEFNLLTPQLVNIYLEAMEYPRVLRDVCIKNWHHDSRNPGFTSVVALAENATGSSCLAGLAYGFNEFTEDWWYQRIKPGLSAHFNVEESSPALAAQNYFQITEVHVLPAYQRKGLGRKLLTSLLETVLAPVAILSTPEVPGESNNAFGLYRHLGFTDVLRNFMFDGDQRPFAVLECPLPLQSLQRTPSTSPSITSS